MCGKYGVGFSTQNHHSVQNYTSVYIHLFVTLQNQIFINKNVLTTSTSSIYVRTWYVGTDIIV